MSHKLDLREHHLFKNRYRILAIPVKAQGEGVKRGRIILLNLALALLVFAAFLVGFSLTGTARQSALAGIAGQYWQNLLQSQLGNGLGAGLAEKSPWILARVGGITSYLLLSASVILGLLTSLRLTDRFLHRANLVYLHKMLSLTTLVFTALHVGGLLLDQYLKITLAESLTPFGTTYRPLWTGLGTLNLYGLVAIVSSFYLAEKFGYKFWRITHYLSFGLFASSLLHGFLAGSDSKSGWMQLIYLVTGFSVIFLVGVRFTPAYRATRQE